MAVDILEVQSYIERHHARIVGPEEVAEAFEVPLETLRKAFRRKVGMPPTEYLRRVRVRRAKRLLAETDLRASEVCRAVGWRREDSGERTFRRATGQTMGEYRRSVRRL